MLVMCVAFFPLSSSHQRFVWDLLSLVAEEDRMDLRRYIRRAADLWFKQNKLSKPFVRAVCSHTSHSGHQIVWTNNIHTECMCVLYIRVCI